MYQTKKINFRILKAADLQIKSKDKSHTRNTLTDKFSHPESIWGLNMSGFKYLPNKENTFSNFKGRRAANIAKTQKSHPEYFNG